MDSKQKWVFIHIGARAHYQFPVAMADQIHVLYTDIWIPQNSLSRILSYLPISYLKKILQRNHPAINSSKVVSFPFSFLFHELLWKIRGLKDWEKIIKRNNWFQKKVANHLFRNPYKKPLVLFAFAYTALEILKIAKDKGWETIVYQMDPGEEEEKIVQKEIKESQILSSWQPAPGVYWQNWKEELNLANHIIVNSSWSKTALLKSKVPQDKIKIIPLSIEENREAISFKRSYPERFTCERPLKVLFLGILTMRKGLRHLLETIELLKDEPIEFTFVGSPETAIAPNSKIKVVDSVSRADTARFYKEADVFLFPTLSDGFGLTQLEAFSWKLPVISSIFSGEVVQNGINGIVLKNINKTSLQESLLFCCMNPKELSRFSDNTESGLKEFTISKMKNNMLSVL